MPWPFIQHDPNLCIEKEEKSTRLIHVVLAGSDKNSAYAFQTIIENSIKQFSIFQTTVEAESFLNLNFENFFDYLDSGLKTLKKHQADILIRICQDKNNIRLNFQTPDLYFTDTPPFFSLLSSIYLPASIFNTSLLVPEISTLIASTLIALCLKKDERYISYLQNFIKILSKNKIPQGIDSELLSHILNLLAFNYIAANMSHFEKQDVKVILNLIKFAQQKKNKEYNALIDAGLLSTLGQMYQCATTGKNANTYMLLERAIESYKKAQKHFNKYVFPYDYGRLSLVLAKLHFRIFKLSNDNQTLRDAIFYLREAEKIFTKTLFENLWAEIEHNLGIYLAVLSSRSNNESIVMLSIQSFEKEQQVYSKTNAPQTWANIETLIADTYYHFGKKTSQIKHLEKAIEHYGNAFEVFAELKNTEKLSQIETYVQKADEEIMLLEK